MIVTSGDYFYMKKISIDRLMAVEENGLKETINHTLQGFNTLKIKEYIYYNLEFFHIWCKNIIYINRLSQTKHKVRFFLRTRG